MNTDNTVKTQPPQEKEIPKEKQVQTEGHASKNEQKPEEEFKNEKKTEEGLENEQEIEETHTYDEKVEIKGGFLVVGIGASAGGLNAFQAFFSGIPKDVNPDMAFVIIQHLDPKHKSILSSLIERYTSLPVYEIEDRMEIKPNCVYVIPPNFNLIYREGFLHLIEPIEPHGRRMPILFPIPGRRKKRVGYWHRTVRHRQ